MTPNELRQRAAEQETRAKAILDSVAAETPARDLTEMERSQVDEAIAQAERLDGQAKEIEGINARVAARSGSTGRIAPPTGGAIEAGESERDKRSGFGDFLVHVGIAGDGKANHREREKSNEILANQYRSHYNSWDDESRPKETRAMSSTSGIAGGYTIGTQFYNGIMSIAAPMSIVRQRAKIIPMDALEIEIPLVDVTTAQAAGTPPYFGGMVGAWTAEAADLSSSDVKFRIGKMVAHELTGYTEVPRTLLATSSISLESLIYQNFGGVVAYYEDYAFLRGDGKGKPLGISASPCRVLTAARGSASAITFANARAVWVKVHENSRTNGVWLASQLAESAILDMTGTANSVFVPAGYTIAGGSGNAAGQAINYALLARPVLITAKLPALNTDMDFGFYDFGQYMVGDTGQMEVAASTDFKFGSNKVAYRFIHRVGGMPWMNNAITLEDGTTTVSPFVSLAIQ